MYITRYKTYLTASTSRDHFTSHASTKISWIPKYKKCQSLKNVLKYQYLRFKYQYFTFRQYLKSILKYSTVHCSSTSTQYNKTGWCRCESRREAKEVGRGRRWRDAGIDDKCWRFVVIGWLTDNTGQWTVETDGGAGKIGTWTFCIKYLLGHDFICTNLQCICYFTGQS